MSQSRNSKNKLKPLSFKDKFKSLDNINTFNRSQRDTIPRHPVTPIVPSSTRNLFTMDVAAPRSLFGSPLPSVSNDQSYQSPSSRTNLQRHTSQGMGLNKASKKSSTESIEDNQLQLVKVLGSTIQNNASVAVDPVSGVVAYPAGSVVVGYSTKKSKRFLLHNPVTCQITAMAFSRDGKLLATGESGKSPRVRIWSVCSGVEISELSGHKYRVGALAFSGQGRYVVSVGSQEDMTINVWDTTTHMRTASSRVTSKVNAVTFCGNGRCFVTVGVRHIRYWYLEDGGLNSHTTMVLNGRNAILGDFMDNTFTDVGCCSMATSSVYVVSYAGQLIEFTEQRTIKRWVELQCPKVMCLSATDQVIVVGCSRGTVFMFDTCSLGVLAKLPMPHILGVNVSTGQSNSSVRGSPDRYPDVIACTYDNIHSRITCFYNDHSFYIWDVEDIHNPRRLVSKFFHSGAVSSVEPVPRSPADSVNVIDTASFVTSSDDDTVRFWTFKDSHRSRSNRLPTEKCQSNLSDELLWMIYSDPFLKYIIDCDRNIDCKVNSSNQSSIDSNIFYKHGIRCLKISSDLLHLGTGNREGCLKIYSLEDCKLLHSISAHNGEILSVDYFHSPTVSNFVLFCSASRDRVIRVMDPSQDYKCIQCIEDHSGAVFGAKIVETPCDQEIRLLSCGMDKSILFRILQPDESGQVARFFLNQHLVGKYSHYDMVVAPNRRYIAVACHDRRVRLYNLVTGKQLKSYRGTVSDDGTLLRCAIDPSGTYLATTGTDKHIQILNISTGDIVTSVRGHSEIVLGMCFLLDLKYLVTVSADQSIFLWRLPLTMTANMKRRQSLEAEPPGSMDSSGRRDSTEGTLTPSRLSDDNNVGSSNIPITSVSGDNVDIGPPSTFRFSVSALPSWAQKKFNRRDSISFVQVNVMNEICGGMSTVMEKAEENMFGEDENKKDDITMRRMSFLSTEKIVRHDDSDNLEEDDLEVFSVERDECNVCLGDEDRENRISSEDEDCDDEDYSRMRTSSTTTGFCTGEGKEETLGIQYQTPHVTKEVTREDHIFGDEKQSCGGGSISGNQFNLEETSNFKTGSDFDAKSQRKCQSSFRSAMEFRRWKPDNDEKCSIDLTMTNERMKVRDQVDSEKSLGTRSLIQSNFSQCGTIGRGNTVPGHTPVYGRCLSVKDNKLSTTKLVVGRGLKKSTSTTTMSEDFVECRTRSAVQRSLSQLLSRTNSRKTNPIGEINVKDNRTGESDKRKSRLFRKTCPVNLDEIKNAWMRHPGCHDLVTTDVDVAIINDDNDKDNISTGDTSIKCPSNKEWSDRCDDLGFERCYPANQLIDESVAKETALSHCGESSRHKSTCDKSTSEEGQPKQFCTDEYIDFMFRTHGSLLLSTIVPKILHRIIDNPNLDYNGQRQVRSRLLFEMETFCLQMRCSLKMGPLAQGTKMETMTSIKEIGDRIVEEVKRQLGGLE